MIQWKQIAGSRYSISSSGEVRNDETGNNRKLSYCTKGYSMFRVHFNNGEKKNFLIHRLVANAFIPNPNNFPQVNHINGNKTDNRLENLEWVTVSQNAQHAFKIGLRNEGFTRNKSRRVKNMNTGEVFGSITKLFKTLNTERSYDYYKERILGRVANDTPFVVLE